MNINLDEVYGLRVEYVEYVVKKGDSLYSIAKRFQTSVNELIDINMLTSNVIYPGQVLLVPKNSANDTVDLISYITKPNDTVVKIAESQNADPILIGNYNDFGTLKLEPGQTILLPNNASRNSSYTVLKDDTVESILSKSHVSALDLLRSNASVWFKTGNTIKF